jgi:hypothetical protein
LSGGIVGDDACARAIAGAAAESATNEMRRARERE